MLLSAAQRDCDAAAVVVIIIFAQLLLTPSLIRFERNLAQARKLFTFIRQL